MFWQLLNRGTYMQILSKFKNPLYANIFILGLSGIIAKLFDFSFRAFYSRALGAEGMGLLSLGFSLHGVMLTIATAGLGIAVSKTASVYTERGNPAAVRQCVRMAIVGVSVPALLVMLITFIFAPRIAATILGDIRIAPSLCTLVPSIIFMGISYCTKGCFYAIRKALPPASSEILEQAVKFVSIWGLLKIFLPYGVQYGCAAVFGGITIGEFSSCLYLLIWYKKAERSDFGLDCAACTAPPKSEILTKLLCVSAPCMITSLCGSLLRMQEEILLISAFKKGGMAHSDAVGMLGIMHGMVMPLLVLPLTLAGSVMSLLVPEISRAEERGAKSLKHTAAKTYRIGISVGAAVGLFFIIFGREISTMLYHTQSAAYLTVCLAPLCPIMFADSLSCSMLNGMGRQMRLLIFSLSDFALRFTLIYFTVPIWKENAFAIMTAASNIFTCSLSFISVYKSVFMPNRSIRFRRTAPRKT